MSGGGGAVERDAAANTPKHRPLILHDSDRAPAEAGIRVGSYFLEEVVALGRQNPSITRDRSRYPIDNHLLQVGHASAFPQFIGKCDDELLERIGGISPVRMGPANSHELGADAALE